MSMSGPRVVAFRQGWALPIFGFQKAHYYRRSGAGMVISLCQRRTGLAGRFLEAGNFPRCKLCERTIRLHGVQAETA